MRKLFSALLLVSILGLTFGVLIGFAQQQWINAKYGYMYFGFGGNATVGDTFMSATSLDGVHWKQSGGTWSGQINAPAAVLSNGVYYFHVANTWDGHLNITTWSFASSNSTTGVITTLFTYDMATSISGAFSTFSGNWYIEGGNGNVCSATPSVCHLFIPVSKTDTSHFIIYEQHATAWPPASSADFSAPVAITVDESNIYDSNVYFISPSASGPCYMWFTHGTDSASHFISLAQSSSAPSCTGSYTTIMGDGVFAPALNEGPIMYPLPNGPGWRIAFEDIANAYVGDSSTLIFDPMRYRDCASFDIDACVTGSSFGTTLNWIADGFPRHGQVLQLFPVPSSTISKATLAKGSIQ